MNNTTSTPAPSSITVDTDDQCTTYRNQYVTARYLFQNDPPEYFALLGVGLAFFFICSILFTIEAKKHAKYLHDAYFKYSARVVMILSAFWMFSLTNFLGILFVRGDIFLHFVSNVFESACLLAFYDCILLHCRALGEVFDGNGFLAIRVPPCCCCLFCLPEIKTTKKNLKWLRFAIIQQMTFQTIVEFIRVLTVFNCSFDPEAPQVVVFDALVLLSFFFAMWAVAVVAKGRRVKLKKFRYIQKFLLFKLMIIIQKLLYKILTFVAGKGHIPSYRGLSAKLRAAIWTNFVTVVVSTILLCGIRKLFTMEDYEALIVEEEQKEVRTLDTECGTTNHVVEQDELNDNVV